MPEDLTKKSFNSVHRGAPPVYNPYAGSSSTGSAPPVYRPAVAKTSGLQPRMAAPLAMVKAYIPTSGPLPIQMKCDLCGRDKGHLSSCERHKNRRGVIAKQKKDAHQESQSWRNMKAYRKTWLKKNNITERTVAAFCAQYEGIGQIRGHATEEPGDAKEQQVTTDDLKAYRNWHTQKYGWVG